MLKTNCISNKCLNCFVSVIYFIFIFYYCEFHDNAVVVVLFLLFSLPYIFFLILNRLKINNTFDIYFYDVCGSFTEL